MNLENPLYERSRLVYSDQAMEKLQNSHVLVAGVGGVGGFVAEALVRAGVGKLTLLDHDVVSASNINRQIIALNSTISQPKVAVMAARLRDINPAIELNLIQDFVTPDTIPGLVVQDDFALIVDAIDSVNCKVSLIAEAVKNQIPIVASMGAGRRIDPTKIEVTDIAKTHTCGLARVIRQRLKKQGISKGVQVVFSTELPKEPGPFEEIAGARGRVINGTSSFMPGLFGLTIAGLVINQLAGV